MKGKEVVHSSGKDDWETPTELFEYFNMIAAEFNLDAAADPVNTKCDNFFTEEMNALERDWNVFGYETIVWLNPPYSQNKEFIKKAFDQSKIVDSVWCLLPVRTCTHWWHDYVMKAEAIYFIRGRVTFEGADNGAPFPSCVVVFTGQDSEMPEVISVDITEFSTLRLVQ